MAQKADGVFFRGGGGGCRQLSPPFRVIVPLDLKKLAKFFNRSPRRTFLWNVFAHITYIYIYMIWSIDRAF